MLNDAPLPDDDHDACLVGRIWVEDQVKGPRPVVVRGRELIDLSELASTMSDLLDQADPASVVRSHRGPVLCTLADALSEHRVLAPCDLQAIKASGVTFAESTIERVIEERARGDAKIAAGLRKVVGEAVGSSLEGLEPGSPASERVRKILMEQGIWSQYLEVAIGPHPEIFTKAQPMSAVGYGAQIGVRGDSEWNNPEPEIVLAISSRGDIAGATLGNDVNLRDFEGRSALLLGTAKDNNASCAIGPFIRLFDARFTLDDVHRESVELLVEGLDGHRSHGTSRMAAISRPPADLVNATIGQHHQYPDGLMLFLGAMHVPLDDRDQPGRGFTHREGDRVRISSPRLGTLENNVTTTDQAPPWTFGVRALMKSLAERKLI